MLIGVDYPKVEFELFGLELVEPNGFIGDVLIFILALYYFFKMKKLEGYDTNVFLKNWRSFYLWFGLSFLVGGFGHLFYKYLEIAGKTPSWYLALLAPYFIEQAMLSIYPKVEKRAIFMRISLIKLLVFVVLETILLLTLDISSAPEKGMHLVTISTTLGLVLCLGVLGSCYQKRIHLSFRYMWIAMFVLLFTAIPQLIKFNPHQYWDRNDLSHTLLLVTLVLYYQTIKNEKNFNKI